MRRRTGANNQGFVGLAKPTMKPLLSRPFGRNRIKLISNSEFCEAHPPFHKYAKR